MKRESQQQSAPPKIRRLVAQIKKFSYLCHSYEIQTFACQKTTTLHWFYVVYRWIVALLCTASFIITLFNLGTGPNYPYHRQWLFYVKYFIYSTNIAMTLNSAQTTFGAILVTRAALKNMKGEMQDNDRQVTTSEFIYWKLQELSVVGALTVTTSYWLVVDKFRRYTIDLNNILGHALNSVFVVSDWMITGLPYNFSDAWFGPAYLTVYYIFTIIYWLAGGYPRPGPNEEVPPNQVLYADCTDWHDILGAIACFVFIASINSLCHVLLCILHFFLKKLRPK